MKAGASKTLKFNVNLPGNVDPATKYVLGWVDSGNAIWEPNGRNNLVPYA